MAKIDVKDTEVIVISIKNEDYICITDMIKAKDGDFFVSDWLRNRNTLEYIGIWEKVYNPYRCDKAQSDPGRTYGNESVAGG